MALSAYKYITIVNPPAIRAAPYDGPLRVDGLQAKAEAIRAAQVETQKELDALMPSVLARAFSGEL